jgi:hypothetical protein
MPYSLVIFIESRLCVLLLIVNNIDEDFVERISFRLWLWCKDGGNNRSLITETITEFECGNWRKTKTILGIIIEII